MSALTEWDADLRSDKFADDGFYAFRDPMTGNYRVMWAEHTGSSIALSNDRNEAAELWVSGDQFDEACWGICLNVDGTGIPLERHRIEGGYHGFAR